MKFIGWFLKVFHYVLLPLTIIVCGVAVVIFSIQGDVPILVGTIIGLAAILFLAILLTNLRDWERL